ncbi:hypothetical protein BDV23DRAFT_186402 [Aspergillus alliaceus]|uniref:Rhodopsin domain-containing protein n=1 Tax=Petromyces alliaceus TaxID=209559 RepID=A0A5N7C0I7_PETAA|nr:hypothetical protein BDV23DRAFT_186402 [Aspergillus alliaceus]
MAWTVALEGWTRLQARQSLDHHAYESINEALVIFGLVTGTLALFVHTYTSVFITRQFGVHNVLTIIAWILAVTVQGLTLHGFTDGGIGKHESTLSESEKTRFTVVILAIIVTFIPLVCVAKLSLIMLYYRLSPHAKLWRICVYAIATIIVIPTPILVFLYLFGCQPVAKAWNATIDGGHCVDRLSIMLASSVLNVITDFLMIIAPIPLIWKLNMRIWQKLGVALMFFLGGITIVTSIFRAVTVDNLLYESDHPYHMAVPILWANAETVLVIICDCLPSLRPFLHRHFPGGCFTGSESSGAPTSGTRNTRQHGRSRYFDDDIELIQNGSNASRSMVITRTVEMELQYHKNEVDVKPMKQPGP